jgi:hypothetical protein
VLRTTTCVLLLLLLPLLLSFPPSRFAPTCEWDTAAADIIVREAGGVVLQAGKLTSTGQHLEDWRVSG